MDLVAVQDLSLLSSGVNCILTPSASSSPPSDELDFCALLYRKGMVSMG